MVNNWGEPEFQQRFQRSQMPDLATLVTTIHSRTAPTISASAEIQGSTRPCSGQTEISLHLWGAHQRERQPDMYKQLPGGRMRSYQLASTRGLTLTTLEPLHNSVQVQPAPSHLCTHNGMRNSMGQLCCAACS